MKSLQTLAGISLLAAAVAVPGVAMAQQAKAGTTQANPFQINDRSTFNGFRAIGDIQIAYQTSEVDGSDNRFRKDFGLQDGVRIKNSSVTLLPDGEEPVGWFDRLQIYGDNVGGNDKYQTWGISAMKSGSYRVNFRDRRVNWFSDVTGAAHSWAPTRHFTDADLSVNFGENVVVDAHFNRYRATSSQGTTRDVSREVFDFNEPLDQTGTNWGVGIKWRLGQTLLYAKQSFRKFTNDSGFGLTGGFSDGDSLGGTTLTAFRNSELQEMTAPVTQAGFNTAVADNRVRISGDVLYSKQEMDFGFGRNWTGTSFLGFATSQTLSAAGSAERKFAHGNARVLWRATDQVSVYAQYRRRSWDQDAVQGFEDNGFDSTNLTAYEITLDQIFGGVEWAVTRGVVLFGEVGTGNRKERFDNNDLSESTKTDALGARFGGRFRSGNTWDGSVSYELGDVDNPFTRITPTKANTFRAKVRFRPAPAWTIAATATVSKSENDCGQQEDGVCEYGSGGLFDGDFGIAEFDTRNYGATIQYTLDEGRWLYGGYTYLDYELNVPIYFVEGFFGNFVTDISRYDSRSSVWTLGGEYALTSTSPLSLYGRLSSTSTSGTFPVTFNDMGIGARYLTQMGLFLDVSARFGKYGR